MKKMWRKPGRTKDTKRHDSKNMGNKECQKKEAKQAD